MSAKARTGRLIGKCLVLSLVASPAFGESLYDSMLLAYQTNPSLRAQEADLRATDESYVQARAGAGPQINFNGQYSYQDARVQQPGSLFSPTTTTDFRGSNGSADLSLVQPLYTSGATDAHIRTASDDILAGRQSLRDVESQVLLNVVTAYVDVRFDREALQIINDEIANLRTEFAETKAKGDLGVLTKTDVAQAQERLLAAQAQLKIAMGNLNIGAAEYMAVVGQNPGELEPEPDLPGVPGTADGAFTAAEANNPRLLAAIETERSAHDKVKQAKAANGPTLSVKLDAAVEPYLPYLQRFYDKNVTAALVLNQPLFTSGMNSSKVREALEQDNRAELTVEATRRDVVQLVARAWDQLTATQDAIGIEKQQVAVEEAAVEGNRTEERVGTRSTIDLLNAESELADTRRALLQARHDQYIAQASLLSAMGLLEIRYLVPSAQRYDPQSSFKHVKAIDAAPWEGAVAAIDRIGEPAAPQPRLSPPGAGAGRPTTPPPTTVLGP